MTWSEGGIARPIASLRNARPALHYRRWRAIGKRVHERVRAGWGGSSVVVDGVTGLHSMFLPASE